MEKNQLLETNNQASKLSQISHPIFTQHQVEVWVKRDDLIHPIISGNKYRKLKYNVQLAQQLGKTTLLSFGGSFSNHIHALAYAAQQAGLKSVGVIRGEQTNSENFTLSCAKHWGMDLEFVNRLTYRERNNPEYLNSLQAKYPSAFIIPEGGSNSQALPGVAEVLSELNTQLEFDTLLTPVGSGGTLAGLVKGDNNQHRILGIAVLKQSGYLSTEVNNLLGKNAHHYNNWQVNEQFHCGGYAKFSPDHAQQILDFSTLTKIPFEPVYSGKMVLALLELLQRGYFKAGEKIVLLHTGGLQGINGLITRGLIPEDKWQPLIPNFKLKQ